MKLVITSRGIEIQSDDGILVQRVKTLSDSKGSVAPYEFILVEAFNWNYDEIDKET